MHRVDLVNVPKAESAAAIRACAAVIEQAEERAGARPVGLLANIESPKALRLAAEIATASPKVVGLQIGWADLLEPLNIDRGNRAAIESIQLTVRLAAGEAGIWAYDGAYPNIADPDGYRREAEAARRLGFIGKSAIHPSQVPIANAVFQPTPDEIAHALKVVDSRPGGRPHMASAPTRSTTRWSTRRSCAARRPWSRWRGSSEWWGQIGSDGSDTGRTPRTRGQTPPDPGLTPHLSQRYLVLTL